MSSDDPVLAAGALVWRRHQGHLQVLLVHRPRYDDWSFPKGKCDRGEPLPVTAQREVSEETGMRVRLGVRLPDQTYRVTRPRKADKVVSYWAAQVVGDDDAERFRANDEVDTIRWVRRDEAASLLSYDRDRPLLDALRVHDDADTLDTRTLVVLRHGSARSRARWGKDDHSRPLTQTGERQTVRLVPLLRAFGVESLLSSSTQRCVDTLEPYAESAGVGIVTTDELTEDGASPARVRRLLEKLTGTPAPAVVCTHRPVLPDVFATLGVEPVALRTADVLVVHHRDGEVVSTEHHERRPHG